ncbi:MAG: hypothetical protein OXU44_06745, partial [Gammaproteobacteria bacterium]|nr:hypothetical protein [Gammaproteobacteria bacterium]
MKTGETAPRAVFGAAPKRGGALCGAVMACFVLFLTAFADGECVVPLTACRPLAGVMKRLAAAALTLALGVAATAASAQPISLGTAANFGEGGSAGIVVRNDNPIVGVITVTFRVTFTGGPPEEDPGTLVRPSGGTRLSAFSGGVATGTDTIGSGHLSGNIQFFIEDVDHLPNGTTRVFTITLLSAMAGGDEIALHSDPASLSRSITIT